MRKAYEIMRMKGYLERIINDPRTGDGRLPFQTTFDEHTRVCLREVMVHVSRVTGLFIVISFWWAASPRAFSFSSTSVWYRRGWS